MSHMWEIKKKVVFAWPGAGLWNHLESEPGIEDLGLSVFLSLCNSLKINFVVVIIIKNIILNFKGIFWNR